MLLRPAIRAIAALLTLAPAIWLAPANAHTEIVSSSPADGGVVHDMPRAVQLTFSEKVAKGAKLSVTGPDGSSVESSEPTYSGRSVTMMIGDASANGTYAVAYRVVADDGHPITGTVNFTVDAAGGGDPVTAQPPSSRGIGWPVMIAIFIGALALGVGGSALASRRNAH